MKETKRLAEKKKERLSRQCKDLRKEAKTTSETAERFRLYDEAAVVDELYESTVKECLKLHKTIKKQEERLKSMSTKAM